MSSNTQRNLAVCALVLVGMSPIAAGAFQPDDGQQPQFIRWSYPVAFHEAAGKEVENIANELSQSLGMASAYKSKTSPGCCLWLEVEPWSISPAAPGYVIVIQHGGALVSATDVAQLKLAARRLGEIRKTNGDQILLPRGLVTNYPVANLNSPASLSDPGTEAQPPTSQRR